MKVIIVGGGFGGVRCALDLANRPGIEVTLISDKRYFEYFAALYRSATGRSPLESAVLLDDFFGFAKNVDVVQDRIKKIDPKDKAVKSESGSKYYYDTLVLALGSQTQYFGIKGLKEFSYGVGSVNEALELKQHIHESSIGGFEEQSYVVVGAGPSGVELAAELVSYVKKVRRKHGVDPSFSVELVEAGDRVLPSLEPGISEMIAKKLDKIGVDVRLKTAVQGETADGLRLPRGEIKSKTVIWTAGVTINDFFKINKRYFQFSDRHRVVVDAQLQARPDVYVIGDCAETKYSGTAQTAIHNARFVARDITRQIESKPRNAYRPKRPIFAVPVGPRWSAVEWGRLFIFGYLGWILRRLADLRLFLSFLSFGKAMLAWKQGSVRTESCDTCK